MLPAIRAIVRGSRRGLVVGAVTSVLLTVLCVPAPASAGLAPACQEVLFVGARGSGQSQSGVTDATDKYDGGTGFGPQVYAAYVAAKGRLMSVRPGTRTAMWSLKYPANDVPVSIVPATIGNYFVGLEDGVWDVVQELKTRDCPNEQIILMGYSQGAMVMHRAIIDLANQGFGAKLDRVAGAILIADGDRLPADNMTRYGSAGSVFFGVAHNFAAFAAPRQHLLPATMTNRIHSICYARDIVCDHSMLGAATGRGIHTGSYDSAAVTPLGRAAMNSALGRAPWNQPAPPPQQPPAQVPAPRDRLEIDQALERGSTLRSANGRYELALQASDGNLVLYAEGRAVWTTRTPGGQRLIMQSDGNLVLYTAQGKAIWSTFTNGKGGRTLVLQDDQNLVLYAPGRAIWASNTVAAAPPPPPPPPPVNPLQAYFSTVVQWDADPKPQKTAWFVDSRGRRRHIQTTGVYSCLMNKGVRGPFRLPASVLDRLPDLNGVGAQCVSDGDVNFDGIVNIADLSIIISRWGTGDRAADQNRNGVVDISDISVVISTWGEIRNGGGQAASRTAAAVAAADVGNLKDFGGRSEAIGVSADGNTIGGNAAPLDGDLAPVVWTGPTSQPQVIDIPGLEDEVMFDFAEDGFAVGTGKDAGGASRAWLRRADGSLRILPVGSASDTYATSINRNGSIAGFAGGSQTRAVVWDTADDQPRILESVDDVNSAAAGIAADGTVVGEIDQVATLWDARGRLVSTEPGRTTDINADGVRLLAPPPDAVGNSLPVLTDGLVRHPLQQVTGQPASVVRQSTRVLDSGIAVGNSGALPVLWSRYGVAEPQPLPDGATLGAIRSVGGQRAVGWVSAGRDEVRHAHAWQGVGVPQAAVSLSAPTSTVGGKVALTGETRHATPEARVQVQERVGDLWLSTGTPVGLRSGRWNATAELAAASAGTARLRVRLISGGEVLATSAEVTVRVVGAPRPSPSPTASPRPKPPLDSRVTAKARKGRSVLLVDVDPNRRKGDYRVTVTRSGRRGWSVVKRPRTHGHRERMVINLPRGRYRARLKPQHGVGASSSAIVRLKR